MTGPSSSLNAVTLATRDMAASVAFYEALGFDLVVGGAVAAFTTFAIGATDYLNLQHDPGWVVPERVWGRFIVFVENVDAVHRAALARSIVTETTPADAPWGERYFHVRDPSGHELSIARPLDRD